jgi:3-oxoacyl-[acyl-carrier protein] reductase
MDSKLAGRTALVTGGTRGIGAAVVRSFLERDMAVWATGRNPEHIDALRSRHSGHGSRLNVRTCDSRDPEAIAGLFEELQGSVARLDLLVGNAGIGIFGPNESLAIDDWDEVMEINARGTFLFAQKAFSWMKRTGGGRIINIASVVGLKGYENQVAYTASKHAVVGLSRVLAREGQKHNIHVCVVCPGGVATNMAKEARPDLDTSGLIRPEDVAHAVLFLAGQPDSCRTDMIELRRKDSRPFP